MCILLKQLPVALMTNGSLNVGLSKKSKASLASLNNRYSAVGIWFLCMKSLANPLSHSICAASLEGPNTSKLFEIKISARPRSNGSSDPITTSDGLFSLHHFSTFSFLFTSRSSSSRLNLMLELVES